MSLDAGFVRAAEARVAAVVAAWRASSALQDATVALGFGPETAARGLGAELDAWEVDGALAAVIARDLREASSATRLPQRVVVLAARTLPASAMRQILWARALGADVVLKPASGQEVLGRALTLGLAGAVHGLACLVVGPDGREAETDAAVASADAVIVLGSDASVARFRSRVRPDQAFVGYGHRLSAAILTAAASSEDLRRLTDDLVAWDQSGCLSPRVLWVAGDSDLHDLGTRLATRLEGAVSGLDVLSPAAAHAQRTAWTRAVMTGRPVLRAGSWCLAVAADGAPYPPEAAPRWLSIAPLTAVGVAAWGPALSTLGLGAGLGASDLPANLASPGLRCCRLGEMQLPPLDWLQDGLAPLSALLRPI